MGKEIENNYHIKILNELKKANIDKKLIDNVYRLSQKQIETLKSKIIEDGTPNTVQEVFSEFLEANKNDKL